MKTTLWLIPYYISWHYTLAIKNILNIWKNFLWFIFNFFSIPTLLKTFFAPFQRLQERYRGGLDIEDLLSTVFINTLMRIVGMIFRSILIVLGLISYLAMVVVGVSFLLIWILLPAFLIALLIVSFKVF